ncbi:uncharacterized protein At2g33490-like isoform X2 [Durio zibethinus]|uniref:Uncharacterized protein At2g33490-like isoform X2 n=1 Tax=Durio zibethinus TaxID=66656 RepID=A0A6P5XAS8_DURZI|nr:uncharacterized protein At2g33490-like isoform X2 [Durio zibethinus]
MKTSLRRLRGFALHKHGGETKDRKDVRPLPQFDELAQASQDMRDCYDSLLSAAAATANSAYEFSESLREMGACLLAKTALNDDEESGKVLLMLGKVQFKLQKLVDSYRSHIFQTITSPSESLLNELRTVEEMKRQCDEKRNVYEYMAVRHKEKGRSKSGKGENFSMQQLQVAHDEYDEEATLFVFRLKSLKQGQSRSLLTQAARHHAAQLCFFKKALKSLEEVEPHVQKITKQQHIDYHFSGLEDDDRDNGEDYDNYENDDDDDNSDDDDDEDDGYDHDDGELSFDYGQNEQDQNMVPTSQHSMKLDQVGLTFPQIAMGEAAKENLERSRCHSFSFRAEIRNSSQSAPLFAENKFDPSQKIQPLLARKFNSYVLPTPVATKGSTGLGNPAPLSFKTSLNEHSNNLWHSSPLEHKKYERILGDKKISGSGTMYAQSILRESNNAASSTRLPPPLSDRVLFSRVSPIAASDSKKIKRQAFSGPLTSKPWPTKPVSVEHPRLFSGPIVRNPMPQLPSTSRKVSPSTSPLVSSPKISELHELPRPPASSASKSSRPLGLVGYSGPLMPRGQVLSATNQYVVSKAASPLPQPPQVVTRSFSIPSSAHRVTSLPVSKPLETAISSGMSQGVASPPLTPISFSQTQPSSTSSETADRS